MPDDDFLYSPKFDKSFFDSPSRSILKPIHNKNNAPKIWTNENIFGELVNIKLKPIAETSAYIKMPKP